MPLPHRQPRLPRGAKPQLSTPGRARVGPQHPLPGLPVSGCASARAVLLTETPQETASSTVLRCVLLSSSSSFPPCHLNSSNLLPSTPFYLLEARIMSCSLNVSSRLLGFKSISCFGSLIGTPGPTPVVLASPVSLQANQWLPHCPQIPPIPLSLLSFETHARS